MRRAGVGVGIDRDRLDAHALGGADHPARDFAAIGDQDLGEHQAEASSRDQGPGTSTPTARRRPPPKRDPVQLIISASQAA
jgi:hypothetical protein